MRVPIQESKLVKTIRFEPEELQQIEWVTATLVRDAAQRHEDPPTESSVIRKILRLGIKTFYETRKETTEHSA